MRLRFRGRGGRLARRRPGGRLRSRRPAALQGGVHPVRPLPHLDVAQRGGGGLHRLAAGAQPQARSQSPRGLSRPRSLQPLHLHRGRARLPRRRRQRRGAGGPGALRSAHPLAEGPRRLRPGRAGGAIPELREGRGGHPPRPARAPARVRPPGRGAVLRRHPERAGGGRRGALLPRHVLRLRRFLEPARPAHVRRPCSRCWRSTGRRPRASCGSTTPTWGTPWPRR